MRLLCVIDHFGSGGAQRQIVELACGLKRRGHQVEIFIYYPAYDFFKARVIASGIPIHEYRKQRRASIGVLLALIRVLRRSTYDFVVSYLSTPTFYAELASYVTSTKLVVSERSTHHLDSSKILGAITRRFHRLADHVVTNSESHREWLEQQYPWLAGKLTCIYNGFDVDAFASKQCLPRQSHDLRLLAIGRISKEKNVLNLVLALKAFYETNGWVPHLSWVGRSDTSSEGVKYRHQAEELVASTPALGTHWSWLGERKDITDLLASHHALIHPALYEGLPNVICEAMAAGRPVLASNVFDHGRLVTSGQRGFLFDPLAPETICKAIETLARLSEEEWLRLSDNASRYARQRLTTDQMLDKYERLFFGLAGEPLLKNDQDASNAAG